LGITVPTPRLTMCTVRGAEIGRAVRRHNRRSLAGCGAPRKSQILC
jgi:hypothetical protein